MNHGYRHAQGDIDYDELEATCEICSQEMDWVSCWNCGGEGGFDGEYLMNSDPLWYDMDDWEDCDVCEGHGGRWMCFIDHDIARIFNKVMENGDGTL